jgi:hypothetical protein
MAADSTSSYDGTPPRMAVAQREMMSASSSIPCEAHARDSTHTFCHAFLLEAPCSIHDDAAASSDGSEPEPDTGPTLR